MEDRSGCQVLAWNSWPLSDGSLTPDERVFIHYGIGLEKHEPGGTKMSPHRNRVKSGAAALFGVAIGRPSASQGQQRRLYTAGHDLQAKVNWSRDYAFFNAAVRHFGGLRDALAAAGIIHPPELGGLSRVLRKRLFGLPSPI